MKDSLNIDPVLREIDRPQIVRQVKHEYKLFGRMKYKKGLKLFSLNIETGDIKEVEIIRQVMIDTEGKERYKMRVNYDPKCLYRQALNMKNAERKFRHFLNNL